MNEEITGKYLNELVVLGNSLKDGLNKLGFNDNFIEKLHKDEPDRYFHFRDAVCEFRKNLIQLTSLIEYCKYNIPLPDDEEKIELGVFAKKDDIKIKNNNAVNYTCTYCKDPIVYFSGLKNYKHCIFCKCGSTCHFN